MQQRNRDIQRAGRRYVHVDALHAGRRRGCDSLRNRLIFNSQAGNRLVARRRIRISDHQRVCTRCKLGERRLAADDFRRLRLARRVKQRGHHVLIRSVGDRHRQRLPVDGSRRFNLRRRGRRRARRRHIHASGIRLNVEHRRGVIHLNLVRARSEVFKFGQAAAVLQRLDLRAAVWLGERDRQFQRAAAVYIDLQHAFARIQADGKRVSGRLRRGAVARLRGNFLHRRAALRRLGRNRFGRLGRLLRCGDGDIFLPRGFLFRRRFDVLRDHGILPGFQARKLNDRAARRGQRNRLRSNVLLVHRRQIDRHILPGRARQFDLQRTVAGGNARQFERRAGRFARRGLHQGDTRILRQNSRRSGSGKQAHRQCRRDFTLHCILIHPDSLHDENPFKLYGIILSLFPRLCNRRRLHAAFAYRTNKRPRFFPIHGNFY